MWCQNRLLNYISLSKKALFRACFYFMGSASMCIWLFLASWNQSIPSSVFCGQSGLRQVF